MNGKEELPGLKAETRTRGNRGEWWKEMDAF